MNCIGEARCCGEANPFDDQRPIHRSLRNLGILITGHCGSTSQCTFNGFAPHLFSKDGILTTIDLNVTQIILFNSPRYSEQIGLLGLQLCKCRPDRRIKEPHRSFLILDLDVTNSRLPSYSSNCSGDESSILYCATDQMHPNIENELKIFMQLIST